MGVPFGRLRSKSLADEVVARLDEAILKGQLKPGEKVVEATLSRQMDVSRAPIREAIRMLAERGLLVQVPRRGVFVREFSTREVEEINELRLVFALATSNEMPSGSRRMSRTEPATVDRLVTPSNNHGSFWPSKNAMSN